MSISLSRPQHFHLSNKLVTQFQWSISTTNHPSPLTPSRALLVPLPLPATTVRSSSAALGGSYSFWSDCRRPCAASSSLGSTIFSGPMLQSCSCWSPSRSVEMGCSFIYSSHSRSDGLLLGRLYGILNYRGGVVGMLEEGAAQLNRTFCLKI